MSGHDQAAGPAAAPVRVACCQVRLAVGDPAGNRDRVATAVTEAGAAGARVIVVPELANSGYVFADPAEARTLAEPLDGPTVTGWVGLAARFDAVIVGGFCEAGPDGVLYNSAVLVDPAGVRARYRKVHLWDREFEAFRPGAAPPPVVATRYGRISVMVCYDLAFPEWSRLAALAGAQLICVPANWPVEPRPPGERPIQLVRAQAAAEINRVFIAVADRTGDERGVRWLGGSAVVGPEGWPLTDPAFDRAATVSSDVDLAAATVKRVGAYNDVFADRHPELYRPVTATPGAAGGPAAVRTG